jgi:hypothetical protein
MSARTESPTGAFVKKSKRMKFDIVGDVHGHYYKLVGLLRQAFASQREADLRLAEAIGLICSPSPIQ